MNFRGECAKVAESVKVCEESVEFVEFHRFDCDSARRVNSPPKVTTLLSTTRCVAKSASLTPLLIFDRCCALLKFKAKATLWKRDKIQEIRE